MELRGLAGGMRYRKTSQDERERQPDLLNKVLKFFVVSFVSACVLRTRKRFAGLCCLGVRRGEGCWRAFVVRREMR